jgi:hypothetical protein
VQVLACIFVKLLWKCIREEFLQKVRRANSQDLPLFFQKTMTKTAINPEDNLWMRI